MKTSGRRGKKIKKYKNLASHCEKTPTRSRRWHSKELLFKKQKKQHTRDETNHIPLLPSDKTGRVSLMQLIPASHVHSSWLPFITLTYSRQSRWQSSTGNICLHFSLLNWSSGSQTFSSGPPFCRWENLEPPQANIFSTCLQTDLSYWTE